jgi:hypothetical protein
MRSIFFGARLLVLASRFGLLFLLLASAGCSVPRGKVSGQVLYKGKPLPGGRITFRPADPKENSVSAELDEQGNYEAVLPAGEVNICVDNRELEPRTGGGPPLPPGLPLSPEARKMLTKGKTDHVEPKSDDNLPKPLHGQYVKIPNKFYKAETSGLTFLVTGGDQKRDIELAD